MILRPQRILVTYASRTGSTTGVANAIADTLTLRGYQVDVHPMQVVADLSPYSAVIAGSAIQGQRWLPEALSFLHTHQAALTQKPFAAFLVCMALAKEPQQESTVTTWLAPVRAIVPTVSEGYFAGALDLNQISSWLDRLWLRFNVWSGVWPAGDHRDWQAIRAWAEALVVPLQL